MIRLITFTDSCVRPDRKGPYRQVVCVSGAWSRLLVQKWYLWFKSHAHVYLPYPLCVCNRVVLKVYQCSSINTTIHVLLEHCCSKYLLTCFYCYKSICPMQGLDPDPLSFDIFMCCYKKNGVGKGICGVGNRSWSPCPWRYKYSLQVCCYKNVCTMYQWRRATGSVPNIL